MAEVSWIDQVLGSSLVVYLLLIIFALHVYLKKTGQTLPELIMRTKESINALTEDKIENVK